MKKIKKYFIKGVVIVCVLSLFSSAILWYEPTKKVNADEITPQQNPIYYFESYYLPPSQQQIIVYVLDAYIIEGYGVIDSYAFVNNGIYNVVTRTNVEFLRYSALDKEDYDAYIYNITLNNYERSPGYYAIHNIVYTEIGAPSGNTIPTSYIYNLYDNYIQYQLGEEFGQNEGYQLGFRDAETYYTEPNEGYETIFNQGYAKGYNEGESAQINTNFMEGIFTNLDAFFSIHLAPYLTIGEILLAPLIIWFVWFLIKQFKGGD